MSDDTTLAVLEASPFRRFIAVSTLAAVGVLLLVSAATTVTEPMWQIVLAVLGGLAAWGADKVRRATALRVELTPEGLRDSSGTWIARMDEIAGVDRGAFAFKPSNGFLVKTRSRSARGWQPGLWWRFGTRIGIGGVTPGAQARVMADILAKRLD